MTVLDLLHGELLLVDAEEVVGGIAIRSFAELPTLLNSGGKRTEFSRAAAPGLGGGQDERLGGGVSGADVMGSTAGSACSR